MVALRRRLPHGGDGSHQHGQRQRHEGCADSTQHSLLGGEEGLQGVQRVPDRVWHGACDACEVPDFLSAHDTKRAEGHGERVKHRRNAAFQTRRGGLLHQGSWGHCTAEHAQSKGCGGGGWHGGGGRDEAHDDTGLTGQHPACAGRGQRSGGRHPRVRGSLLLGLGGCEGCQDGVVGGCGVGGRGWPRSGQGQGVPTRGAVLCENTEHGLKRSSAHRCGAGGRQEGQAGAERISGAAQPRPRQSCPAAQTPPHRVRRVQTLRRLHCVAAGQGVCGGAVRQHGGGSPQDSCLQGGGRVEKRSIRGVTAPTGAAAWAHGEEGRPLEALARRHCRQGLWQGGQCRRQCGQESGCDGGRQVAATAPLSTPLRHRLGHECVQLLSRRHGGARRCSRQRLGWSCSCVEQGAEGGQRRRHAFPQRSRELSCQGTGELVLLGQGQGGGGTPPCPFRCRRHRRRHTLLREGGRGSCHLCRAFQDAGDELQRCETHQGDGVQDTLSECPTCRAAWEGDGDEAGR